MKREADMSVLQVSLIAMVAVLLAIQLKGGRAEYGFLINLAAGIFLFSALWENWKCLFGQWNRFKAF